MRSVLSIVLLVAAAGQPLFAQEPPPFLQLTIERIEPGGETEYGSIEERLAEMCARLRCPNSYLALESIDSPKEVWWLVMYASQADVDRVAAAYAENATLVGELRALSALKQDITAAPIAHLTRHRADLGDGPPWRVGATQFAAIAATGNAAPAGGAVFEAEDGSRFLIASAATRAEADAAAQRLGPSSRIFAVRPEWSRPDDEWVAANRELWKPR